MVQYLDVSSSALLPRRLRIPIDSDVQTLVGKGSVEFEQRFVLYEGGDRCKNNFKKWGTGLRGW